MKKSYKPKLIIDTVELTEGKDYDAFFDEISKYSITPTTFKDRALQNLEAPIFQETYQYKNSIVSRFGLHANSQLTKELVETYNTNLVEVVFDAKSIVTQKSEAAKIEAIKKCCVASHELISKFELQIVNDAIQYLRNLDTDKQPVLVDIFERDNNNKIQLKGGIPQTHTVVLYNQLDKVLVIDPSNANFSHILAGAHKDIVVCFSSKPLQIYKPSGKTGFSLNEYRDCIDIAVKLAFSLQINKDNIQINTIKNKGEYAEIIDFYSLKESSSLKDITNQRELYPTLPKILETVPVRAKQSSDIGESKFTTLFLKKLNKSMLEIDEKLENSGIDPYHLKSHYQNQNLSNLKFENEHRDYIGNMKKYISVLDKEINYMGANNSYIQEQEESLIGEVLNQHYGENL